MTYYPPHISRLGTKVPGAPESALQLAPKTVTDVQAILRYASERDLVVQVWGGGTHSGFGAPPQPDLLLAMERLDDIERWEPDDLTIVLAAGARIEDVESRLNERNQSLGLPERPGSATVGGVVAAGISGLRRGRLYGTRERVLETTLVTGDGRVVRSGGRVVKNVTGYDLHRLAVGAFGSLGVIVSICLKLWPTPPGKRTVQLEDVEQAATIVRPLAVLETEETTKVFLQGTEAEVDKQARRLGGETTVGLDWPEDPRGSWEWSLRVPPARTADAVSRLPTGWRYIAIHRVGEVRAASGSADGAGDLRSWAESTSGHLVVTRGDREVLDPWGTPPPGLELQRRIISEFDPRRILNPGRLPGGL